MLLVVVQEHAVSVKMSRTQLGALWACVAYFAFVLAGAIGRAMWGNLGVFRPSDMQPDPDLVPRDRAAELLNAWAEDYARLTWLVVLGVAMLFSVLLWVTVSHCRSRKLAAKLTGDGRDRE